MNKFLRYSLSLVLVFVASVTFAQEVTFDPKIRKQSQWQSQLQ